MNRTHFRTIVFVVGVLLGVWVAYRSEVASELAVLTIVLALCNVGLLLWGKIIGRRAAQEVSGRHGVSTIPVLTLLICVGFSVGVVRVQTYEEIRPLVCSDVCTVRAVVVGKPTPKGTYQQVQVALFGDGYDKTAHVLLRTPLYPEYSTGQVLLITGTISKPRVIFPHNGSKSFDYASYLATQHIGSESNYPRIEVVEDSKLFGLKQLGDGFVLRIESLIPPPFNQLAVGMLFGLDSLSKDLKELFRIAGISHIVVLSGFNIAVVVAAALFMFSFMPLQVRLLIALATVCSFVMMVGGGSSVVRATLMSFISIAALSVGRTYNAKQALVLSLLLIVMYSPSSLLSDVSLHLSFLATVGIVYGFEKTQAFLSRFSNKPLLDVLSSSLVAYLATAPYVLYAFGSVSLYSLIANCIVVPLVPLAMLLSFLVVVLSYVWSFAALIVAFIDTFVLWVIVTVAKIVAVLPYATLEGSLSFVGMWCVYLVLVCLLFVYRRPQQVREVESQAGNRNDVLVGVVSY